MKFRKYFTSNDHVANACLAVIGTAMSCRKWLSFL